MSDIDRKYAKTLVYSRQPKQNHSPSKHETYASKHDRLKIKEAEETMALEISPQNSIDDDGEERETRVFDQNRAREEGFGKRRSESGVRRIEGDFIAEVPLGMDEG